MVVIYDKGEENLRPIFIASNLNQYFSEKVHCKDLRFNYTQREAGFLLCKAGNFLIHTHKGEHIKTCLWMLPVDIVNPGGFPIFHCAGQQSPVTSDVEQCVLAN